MASPMPLAAPVTTAVRPSKLLHWGRWYRDRRTTVVPAPSCSAKMVGVMERCG